MRYFPHLGNNLVNSIHHVLLFIFPYDAVFFFHPGLTSWWKWLQKIIGKTQRCTELNQVCVFALSHSLSTIYTFTPPQSALLAIHYTTWIDSKPFTTVSLCVSVLVYFQIVFGSWNFLFPSLFSSNSVYMVRLYTNISTTCPQSVKMLTHARPPLLTISSTYALRAWIAWTFF